MTKIANTLWSGLLTGLLLVCGLGLPGVAVAQGAKPLTAADLTQMKTAGFDDQTVIGAIAANGVSLDTSVAGLTALKQSGLSEKVISAALAAAAPKTTAAASPDAGLPDEIGVYVQANNQLTPLPVEVVNFKTAGMLGTAFTYGIKKTKIQGTVPGLASTAQLKMPLTIVMRCPDGSAPTEYQLIQLDLKKDNREFTEAKMNIAGASAGTNSQAVTLKFDKIGHNTYKTTLNDLKKGEYGFLSPGTAITPGAVSNGKLYSFGMTE